MTPGQSIGGRYRLLRKIGEGAMGSVWEAVNELTSRRVALKLVLNATDQHRYRLLREARALGRLSHRNVIEVLDVGELENGDPFLVMQLLSGETLGELLARQRRLAPPLVAQIGRDIARALAMAHAAGIIHRDLKPANIFLHREAGTEGAVVKVLDFGVCKNMTSDATMATAEGKMVGSPAYMSPEQLNMDRALDPRTDIWSLGVLLFEMLTGVRPFRGDRVDVVLSIFRGDIPRVSDLVKQVDPQFVELVSRCLTRDREQRIGSAHELAALLQAHTGPEDNLRTLEASTESARAPSPASSAEGNGGAIGETKISAFNEDTMVTTLYRPASPSDRGHEAQRPKAKDRLAVTVPLKSTPWVPLPDVGLGLHGTVKMDSKRAAGGSYTAFSREVLPPPPPAPVARAPQAQEPAAVAAQEAAGAGASRPSRAMLRMLLPVRTYIAVSLGAAVLALSSLGMYAALSPGRSVASPAPAARTVLREFAVPHVEFEEARLSADTTSPAAAVSGSDAKPEKNPLPRAVTKSTSQVQKKAPSPPIVASSVRGGVGKKTPGSATRCKKLLGCGPYNPTRP